MRRPSCLTPWRMKGHTHSKQVHCSIPILALLHSVKSLLAGGPQHQTGQMGPCKNWPVTSLPI